MKPTITAKNEKKNNIWMYTQYTDTNYVHAKYSMSAICSSFQFHSISFFRLYLRLKVRCYMEFSVSAVFFLLFFVKKNKLVVAYAPIANFCINIAHANMFVVSGSIDHMKIKLYNFGSSFWLTSCFRKPESWIDLL